MSADLGSGVALYNVVISRSDNFHLLRSGSDESQSGMDDIAVLRFTDLHTADPVQTLRVHVRKSLRHMLRDHDAGNICRKLLQHGKCGFRSPGGSTQADDGGVQDIPRDRWKGHGLRRDILRGHGTAGILPGSHAYLCLGRRAYLQRQAGKKCIL